MEDKRDNSDALWDGLLSELGRRETLAPSPSKEQTARWMRTIAATGNVTAHRHWHIWSTYAAAAAVLVMAVLVGLFVSRNNLTADEVFVSVDNSIAASPVVSFSLCDLQAQKHLMDMEFMGSNTDGSVYVNLNIRPSSDADAATAVRADLAYVSKDSRGVLLIRSLSCGGENLLADMDPSGRGVALRFENISNSSARSRFLPGRVELSSIRELIDSLKNSASDFQVSKINASRSEIFGVIDKPQNISIGALMQSAMIASYANMLILGIGTGNSSATLTPQAKENFAAAGQVLMGSQFGSLLKVLPKQVDRLFRFLAACEMYRGSGMDKTAEFRQYRQNIDKALNAMRVTIIYDRKSDLIQRVTLKDSNDVSVNIRFTSDDELQLRMDEILNLSKKASDFVNPDQVKGMGK